MKNLFFCMKLILIVSFSVYTAEPLAAYNPSPESLRNLADQLDASSSGEIPPLPNTLRRERWIEDGLQSIANLPAGPRRNKAARVLATNLRGMADTLNAPPPANLLPPQEMRDALQRLRNKLQKIPPELARQLPPGFQDTVCDVDVSGEITAVQVQDTSDFSRQSPTSGPATFHPRYGPSSSSSSSSSSGSSTGGNSSSSGSGSSQPNSSPDFSGQNSPQQSAGSNDSSSSQSSASAQSEPPPLQSPPPPRTNPGNATESPSQPAAARPKPAGSSPRNSSNPTPPPAPPPPPPKPRVNTGNSQWLLYLAMLVGLGFFAWMMNLLSRKLTPEPSHPLHVNELGENEQDPDRLYQLGCEAAARGDKLLAVRYFSRAVLLRLDEQRMLDFDDSRTNGECLRELARRTIGDRMRPLLSCHDAGVYGDVQPSDEDLRSFRTGYEALRSQT